MIGIEMVAAVTLAANAVTQRTAAHEKIARREIRFMRLTSQVEDH
jgi:hypothetical protein